MSWFTKSPPSSQPPAPGQPTSPVDGSEEQLNCSFCGKSRQEVRKLIAGPEVYICDECVQLCRELVDEQLVRPPLIPKEAGQLLAELDEHVVGLRGAKRAIVAALRQHVLRLGPAETSLPPLRLLLVGPCGSGKTTLGRALCACAPVPSYHADVGRLSESGYVGEDVENLLAALIQRSGNDLEWAQQGVLFLDGLEKIRADRPLNKYRDISGESVQRELLRLLDGLPCEVPDGARRHPQAPTHSFVGERLLIAGAASLELAELPPGPTDRELRDALRAAGFRGEFLARFDRLLLLGHPDEDALLGILDQPRGLVADAHRAVEALGGSLSFSPEALRALARSAAVEQDGAWALARPIQRYLEEVFAAPNPARVWQVDEPLMESLIVGSSEETQARRPYR